MPPGSWTAPELSAYRNVLGMVPSLALLVWTGELRLRGSNLRIANWPVAVGRGVAVAFAQLFFYAALARLERTITWPTGAAPTPSILRVMTSTHSLKPKLRN